MKCLGRLSSKVFILLVSIAKFGMAAPCCGGGQGQSSLILGDERFLLTAHYLFSTVAIDALSDGQYLSRDGDQEEYQHTYMVEGSYLLSDRWQVGASVPLIYRYVAYEAEPNNVGFGDMQLQAAWEVLPEIRYSSWQPRVFLTPRLGIPLGSSPWSGQRPATSFSKGFWNFSLGAFAVKQWAEFDASVSYELHKGLPKNVDIAAVGDGIRVNPGIGTSFAFSVGYRFGSNFHVGATESFSYDSGVTFYGASIPASLSQYFWSTSLSLGYSFLETWTVLGTYTDQTLFGAARNVALSRIFGISIQKTWLR